MSKLTEEEMANLDEELIWCKENLKYLRRKLSRLSDAKTDCLSEIHLWNERFEKADREIALATRLTICTGKRKRKGIVKSLEKILEDKDKLKKFIKLLEDEGGEL